jgi:hypothetical protein
MPKRNSKKTKAKKKRALRLSALAVKISTYLCQNIFP